MKILKKITVLICILLLSTTLTIYAGTTAVKLTVSSDEVKAGETVIVTLSGNSENGIEGFDAVLKYDKTKLKLTNESQLAGEDYSSLSGTDDLNGEFRLSLMYVGSGAGKSEADLAKLEFKVLDGVEENETLNIKLTDIQLIDSMDNGEELDDVEIDLKVVKEGDNTGGNDNTSGGNNNTSGGNNNTSGGNDNISGDYPYTGLKNYIFIILFALIIAGIISYIKINKYRNIK